MGHSFIWASSNQSQTAVSGLTSLMKGWTVGFAMEAMKQRYAEIATLIAEQLRDVDNGADPLTLGSYWTVYTDARNYLIVGDPATHIS